MDSRHRIVSSLPIEELWTDAGPLSAKRLRYISPDDLELQMLLQAMPMVVAECGKPLHWVQSTEYWNFWKRNVTRHLTTLESWTEG